MGTSFLDVEDKQLVQLARVYADEGRRVSWPAVAKKMKRWKRNPQELARRLNSLKRTYGSNLAEFPPSFYAVVPATRGRRPAIIQQIRGASRHEKARPASLQTSTQAVQDTSDTCHTEEVVSSMNTRTARDKSDEVAAASVVERRLLKPDESSRAIREMFSHVSRAAVLSPPGKNHLNTGELLPIAISVVLSAVDNAWSVSGEDVFMDIGAGIGNVVAQIALESEVKLSVGVEIRASLVEIGKYSIAQHISRWPRLSKVELHHHDVCDLEVSVVEPFSTATIIYANNLLFQPSTNIHIQDELALMPRARVVAVTDEICPRHGEACAREFCARYELKAVVRVPASWTSHLVPMFIYTSKE